MQRYDACRSVTADVIELLLNDSKATFSNSDALSHARSGSIAEVDLGAIT